MHPLLKYLIICWPVVATGLALLLGHIMNLNKPTEYERK